MDSAWRRKPLEGIWLPSDSEENLALIMKDGKIYPNVANLLPAKTARPSPEHAICALARLRRDLTCGEVRFDLPETVRGHIWPTLARFSSTQVCNFRVYKNTIQQ